MFWKKNARPALDDVTFDTATLAPRGAADGVRAWTTPEGDVLSRHFFDLAPDLPRSAEPAALRAFYDEMLAGVRGGVVELAPFRLDGLKALRTIVKVPQQPSGLAFVASITLPFRDFSFVVKVQCAEHGATGMRESVLLAQHMAKGGDPVENADGTLAFPGFEPYHAQHDAAFPDHPLSRARRVMEKVTTSLRVSPEVMKQPEFDGVVR
jgi:hypothetical protein